MTSLVNCHREAAHAYVFQLLNVRLTINHISVVCRCCARLLGRDGKKHGRKGDQNAKSRCFLKKSVKERGGVQAFFCSWLN